MNALKTNKFKVGDEVKIVKLDKTLQYFGGAGVLSPLGTKTFVPTGFNPDTHPKCCIVLSNFTISTSSPTLNLFAFKAFIQPLLEIFNRKLLLVIPK